MIINSILDTDFYKLTMQNAVIQSMPELKVRYKFTDRNGLVYPKGFAEELIYEISKLGELCLTEIEEKYLRSLNIFPATYVDFLKGFRFDPSEVSVSQNSKGQLNIQIEGPWYKTILWEVPLMALISELYYRELEVNINIYKFMDSDSEKANMLTEAGAHFADFGTRRRFSQNNQERVISTFNRKKYPTFVGTSNVMMAREHEIKPIGTMAHEWIMVMGSLYGYKMANRIALTKWADIYKGDLGIALSDTYTTKTFFKSFDKRLAKLFDGVRHDSGDAFEFVDKVLTHYKKLGINPMSKVIVFSDGLNPNLAVEIKKYCIGKIKSSFGIGTNFSNDVGVKPLNIVIKVSEVYIDDEWYPAVKLSDNPGKHTGDPEEINLCKSILRI